MKHYFCYSSSLDPAAFDQWKQQHGYLHFSLPEGRKAQALGVAMIFDFPSRFWGGRVAGLKTDSASNQWGLLFAIDDNDWSVITHKEGVMTGASIEIPVRVKLENGEMVDASAFTTNPERVSLEGPLSETFLATLRKAYEARGLPISF